MRWIMKLSGEKLLEQFQILRSSLSSNESIWLIAGDIDNFGLYNQIYSKNIVDVLHDLIIEQIDESISQLQTLECMICYSVYGDDLIILIKSSLDQTDIIKIIQKIISSVSTCCYKIICLDSFQKILDQLTVTEQKLLLEALDDHLIFVDPFRRKKGHLALVVGYSDLANLQTIARLQVIIANLLPQVTNSLKISLNWLFNSQTGCYETFNNGIIWPISMSFGGIILNPFDDSANTDFGALIDRAHRNLLISKKHPALIAINQDSELPARELDVASNITFNSVEQNEKRIPLCSLRYFKDIITGIISNDQSGTLISLEPTYTIEKVTKDLSLVQKQLFRGNPHGVGIKGINQLCGQNIGDKLITNMVFSVSDAVLSFCHTIKLNQDSVKTAMFIDRFQLYFSNIFLTDGQIRWLADSIIAYFSSRCTGIKISLLIMNYTFNNSAATGQSLIYQLELLNALPIDYNLILEPIVLRQFSPQIEEEAMAAIESKSFQAAQLLQSKHIRQNNI